MPAKDVVVLLGEECHAVEILAGHAGIDVRVRGRSYRVNARWRIGAPLAEIEIDGQSRCLQVERKGIRLRLGYRGAEVEALVCSPRAAALSRHMLRKAPADLSRFLLSPMPGLLVRLSVQPGQRVKAGEELCVVEAMKMENRLCAVNDVTVKSVLAGVGQTLLVDQPIVEFE
jgi:propionyl-CoA carboxylase alpha chain